MPEIAFSAAEKHGFSIGELAREYDVTTHATRFYEHEGQLILKRLASSKARMMRAFVDACMCGK